MTSGRRSRDDRLLDALAQIEGQPYEGPMWRVVRSGRSVLDGSRGAGRWNPAQLSVLYGAEEPDGAIAEIHFHLTLGQSVFPSRMEHELHELRVRTRATLNLADMAALERLGVDAKRYSGMLYDRTREIADAADFLGFDGIIAPSARWSCQNIVLFCSRIDFNEIETVSSRRVDWSKWRQASSR